MGGWSAGDDSDERGCCVERLVVLFRAWVCVTVVRLLIERLL